MQIFPESLSKPEYATIWAEKSEESGLEGASKAFELTLVMIFDPSKLGTNKWGMRLGGAFFPQVGWCAA